MCIPKCSIRLPRLGIEQSKSKSIKKVELKGFWYVLGSRILPFAPSSIINGVSGISSIKLFPFTMATTFGTSILLVVYTLIQEGLLSQSVSEYLVGIIFLSGYVFFFVVKKLIFRKRFF
ncbi:VTT domain-containing protein [Priestia endophytica]|uniref:VTT domain-containing protein n=1 Tax=Priestia endophytica TaxID=135735 RepID=UPI003AF2C6A7